MTFEEAIIQVLRVYWDEKSDDFDSLSTSQGPRKYNKKYFDSFSDKPEETTEKVKK